MVAMMSDMMSPEENPPPLTTRFEALRLRAKSGDVEGRRAPFFVGAASESSAELERATSAALRAMAVGDSMTADGSVALQDALWELDKAAYSDSAAYASALRESVKAGDATSQRSRFSPKSAFHAALGRLAAEVAASKTEVDFCLSLADRVLPSEAYSATRELNSLSNQLLRAASYGEAADVDAARDALSDSGLQADLCPEASAYVEALCSLAAPTERSAEKALVVEAALSTFFDQKPTTLADRLGPAYSVALQRFLGELTRRGAIAGRKPAESPAAPAALVESPSRSSSSSSSSFAPQLGFNFVEWEMRLRRDLATQRDAQGAGEALLPRDFVGKWKVVLVSGDDATPLAPTPDILASADAIDVTFKEDGQVCPSGGSANNPFEKFKTKWTVRPGPAHLDTCEFDLDLKEKGITVTFCGYVDRGQRIESRFSRRPIKISGFAFEQATEQRGELSDDVVVAVKSNRRPSGRFAMLGPNVRTNSPQSSTPTLSK